MSDQGGKTVIGTRTDELADRISVLAERLHEDGETEPEPLLREIREVRRSLTALEYELQDRRESTVGEAC